MDVPRRLGRYELLERVGEGSLGVLYRGRDTVLDREVAAKVMLSAFYGDKDAHARFFREAKAAARLQHVNIVTIFEFGEHEGTPYIVMEFLHGGTLADRLDQPTPIALGEALDIAVQVCAGLDAAHHQGVVHRAVNPGNVWLCRDGTVKLLDFGIATAVSSSTTLWASPGKAAYLAPEQLEGRDVDGRSDIFAVGVMLYEMLAGRRPFDASSTTALISKIINDTAAPVDSPDIPRELSGSVSRALAKAPDARFSNAAELLTRLKHIKAELSSEPDGATVLLHPTIVDPGRPRPEDTHTFGAPALAPVRLKPSGLRLPGGRAAPALARVHQWLSGLRAPKAIAVPSLARVRQSLSRLRVPRAVAVWVSVALVAATTAVGVRSLLRAGARPRPTDILLPAPNPGAAAAESSPGKGGTPPNAKPAPVRSPAPAAPATLRITSQPSAARVSVDGRNSGQTTPAQLSLTAGQTPAAIQIDLPGYEPARLVVTKEMLREGTVDVTLVARTPPKSLLLVATGDYPFAVTDGREVLSKMSERHDLDVSGLRSVQLRSDQYFLNQHVRLDSDTGGSIKVSAPPLGSISVYASGMLEDCKVYLDDRLVDAGSIPVANRRVASGSHRVQLRCDRGDTDPQPVKIGANQDVAARFPKDTPLRPK